MAQTELHTYTDAVEHLLDWGGVASTDAVMLRKAKRAVENAYREVCNVRAWSYYHKTGRLQVADDYNTGSIAFDYTGGTYERQVTLSGGTWPAVAKYGFIRIANVDYEIEDRKSSTVITLSVNTTPTEDLAAGTAYEWFRDTYPLPVDLHSIGLLRDPVNSTYPGYVPVSDFMGLRSSGEGASQPRVYTLLGDQNYLGTIAIRFYPPPDDDYHYEYLYRRRPRSLGMYQYNTGTVTTSGTTLTGSGTTFTSNMIGCVVRLSSSASVLPTGTIGTNPFVENRVITSFTSATVLGLDQALSSELSGVKFEISDPIDLEAGAMYTAFLRRCELELGQLLNRDDISRLSQQAQAAEVLAKESDSRSFERMDTATYRRVPLRWEIVNA